MSTKPIKRGWQRLLDDARQHLAHPDAGYQLDALFKMIESRLIERTSKAIHKQLQIRSKKVAP